MKSLVGSRWFALTDLAAVTISIVLWELNPDLGWQPLLIALIPWFIRIIAGKAPFKRTKFDLLILAFIITAAIGIWAAYDREAAWVKFWLLIGGIFVYYGLVNQPQENLWLAIWSISALAIGIAGYFLLTYDWQVHPADFQVLTRLGQWWMARRPVLELRIPEANLVGGILAMLLPFPLVLSLQAWHQRKLFVLSFACIVSCLTLFGLLMTSSRAAWAALAIALFIWFLWTVVGWLTPVINRITRFERVTRRSYFIIILFVLSGLVGIVYLNSSSGLISLFNNISGARDGGSRLTLYKDSINLFQDFIFTGGGLGAFAGLYSRYILVIPYYFFGYAHNLYLDLALEQGLFGVLAFLAIFGGCIWLIVSKGLSLNIHWAVLTSLLVIGLHGILDDSLYGMQGTSLLFLSSGLAVASTSFSDTALGYSQSSLQSNFKNMQAPGFVVFTIVIVVFTFFYRAPLTSRWFANLGSVQMAREELAGFPAVQWEDSSKLVYLASSEQNFNRALKLSQHNVTANYHLGLIFMLRRDYPHAIEYLQDAWDRDPDHRGIRKNLGYSMVWTGQFDRALSMLNTIPEARNEMDVYSWWWGTQGRDDLAENARSMVMQIDEKTDEIGSPN